MFFRWTFVVSVCLFPLALSADDLEAGLERIEALTGEQAVDSLLQYLSAQSRNCRIEIAIADRDIWMENFFRSMLTELDVPEKLMPQLLAPLEQKLGSFDSDQGMEATLDAAFEIVNRDDGRVILHERDCEVLGS